MPSESLFRIDLTVNSLEGILVQRELANVPIALTATITFSGSISDMQVHSSTICGITGQLQIESETVDVSEMTASDPFRLAVMWPFQKLGRRKKASPHLMLRLPPASIQDEVQKKLETRNSNVSDGIESLAYSQSIDFPQDEFSVPEIIEIHVRINGMDDGEQKYLWKGIAHFVFSNDMENALEGSRTLHLPVNEVSSSCGTSKSLVSNMMLNIQVNVSNKSSDNYHLLPDAADSSISSSDKSHRQTNPTITVEDQKIPTKCSKQDTSYSMLQNFKEILALMFTACNIGYSSRAYRCGVLRYDDDLSTIATRESHGL